METRCMHEEELFSSAQPSTFNGYSVRESSSVWYPPAFRASQAQDPVSQSQSPQLSSALAPPTAESSYHHDPMSWSQLPALPTCSSLPPSTKWSTSSYTPMTDKKQRKRDRNREAAARSRQRHRVRLEQLEVLAIHLQLRNQRLQRQLEQLKQVEQEETVAASMTTAASGPHYFSASRTEMGFVLHDTPRDHPLVEIATFTTTS